MPLGVVKAHSLEVTVARRYSNGLSANFAFSANDVTENRSSKRTIASRRCGSRARTARPFRISGGAVYELPFGANKTFLPGRVLRQDLRRMADGRHVRVPAGRAARVQQQRLLQRRPGQHREGQSGDRAAARRHARSVEDLVQHGGLREAAAAQPASFQKRAFPFRIDDLRGPGFFLVNANIVRNFGIGGGRSLQFRLDVQNLFDSVLWQQSGP